MSTEMYRGLGASLRELAERRSNGDALSGVMAFGSFEVENLTRGGKSVAHNLVTTQGLNHILDVVLGSTSAISTWYLAPFAGNATPAAGWTAANFDSNSTEFTNYTEAVRQTFSPGSASGGVIGNLSSRAEITIGTPGQDTIYGVGLLSASGKEATTGVLLSAARLASARTGLLEDDVIAIGYTLTLTDAS